jgi:DNA-directed RNA polymerase specialized sigma24 family protein
MRRRLVSYFDRKNCVSPDELADETLNRVARRLQEEGVITNTPPARYCYILAKFVFLEYTRRADRNEVDFESFIDSSQVAHNPDELFDADAQDREKLLDCLERCLADMEPDNRELICQYYYGEQRAKIEGRRALSVRLGLTMNALSIRACRIRARLLICVNRCAKPEN